MITLSMGLNYPYLEQMFMAPKMFESLEFDCIFILQKLHKRSLGDLTHMVDFPPVPPWKTTFLIPCLFS